MKYILYLLVLSVLATGITSCESDSTSSDSTSKEIEVTPSKTRVARYEIFSVKARMTNTPLSDVYFSVDFGDSTQLQGISLGSATQHSYIDEGEYTITLTAYDSYTDLPIATKTLSIIVSDVIPIVAFSRDLIDTTVQTDNEGKLVRVYFPFTSNSPISKVKYQFGDGNSLLVGDGDMRSYTYQSPGTHKVIIDVYNDKGDYWASDTMTCIIRLPEVTLDMLTSAYNVSVALFVDSTSVMYPPLQPYAYLQTGIGNLYDSVKRITWTGNSFNALYLSGTNRNYEFTGTISSDLKNIETMTVSVIDSFNIGNKLKYSYTLSNLELCGMNDNVVIYRAAYRPLSTFVTNEYFEAKNYPYDSRRIGDVSGMTGNIISAYIPPPYAYVVFTRK